MKFRMYEDRDFDNVTDLFLKVFTKEPWNDEWESRERAEEYISDMTKFPKFRGYLVEDENRIIGMAFGYIKTWWQGNELFINELCIDDELQGKGIGSMFMEYIKDLLCKENAKYIILLTDKDTPAEKFYLKNGFHIGEDNLFMGIKL